MSMFRETNYMGKYLGVTLSGNTLRRKQNKYLMEKLSYKMANWKTNHLSFAGHITLVNKVLEAVSIYPIMMNLVSKHVSKRSKVCK